VGVNKIRQPGTQAEVWEVVCDGDPSCPDSGYMTTLSGAGIDTVCRTYTAYGWEMIEKSIVPELVVEAYCPEHTTNPPAPPRFGSYFGAPYGPGTEEYRERLGMR
jgi:hypothetical protein